MKKHLQSLWYPTKMMWFKMVAHHCHIRVSVIASPPVLSYNFYRQTTRTTKLHQPDVKTPIAPNSLPATVPHKNESPAVACYRLSRITGKKFPAVIAAACLRLFPAATGYVQSVPPQGRQKNVTRKLWLFACTNSNIQALNQRKYTPPPWGWRQQWK